MIDVYLVSAVLVGLALGVAVTLRYIAQEHAQDAGDAFDEGCAFAYGQCLCPFCRGMLDRYPATKFSGLRAPVADHRPEGDTREPD